MALLMEPGSEPLTEGEKADLDAIAAIKESAAREYREEGNQFVKKGRKHYPDAVDCYTKAIAQMGALSPPSPDASVLFANRAHVNLLLGNHRRALDDAEQAVRLSPANLKAHYRAAKAALALDLLPEAASFCRRGLEHDPASEELKKFLAQVEAQQRERDLKRAKVEQAISAAKELAAAIEKRGLRLGKAAYQELTRVKKPKLDDQGLLHWPVLLLYPEVMSSDFIEDFPETDLFSDHLDLMFSESSPPLPWDENHAYTREAIEMYCQAGDGTPFSKSELLKYLLEGTVDSGSLPESLDGEDGERSTVKGSTAISSTGQGSSGKWIKVREGKTLQEALQHKDYIIPAVPVFFVVSRKSAFYSKFKDGKWSLP
ncbi:tetratricopeptide repeat protein 4 homolog isoform X1 [Hordeum vulgare subsp. vulgare]|uniref:Cns1/TTC4 wheel domain-containing protein n=1 Tax=Hordeum vulgare subsp. vulgare TaxID=112509 RepID=A0A8I6Y697_HORVV|nr:tetratricopeptide repeat protein 4 homolog isoform X1 [Hordeum vulgare subsp. vulgare]